jgi:predicted O-linked N-acetylglucosamine transferase (SPINDLY family)
MMRVRVTSLIGRMAGSMLRAVGLPELIAKSLPEYEALALRLAREPDALTSADNVRRLRRDLPPSRAQCQH